MLSKSTAGRNAVPREGNKRFSRGLREFSQIDFKNPRQSAKSAANGFENPLFLIQGNFNCPTLLDVMLSGAEGATKGDNLKGELRKVS
jgi:hypothetical protein